MEIIKDIWDGYVDGIRNHPAAAGILILALIVVGAIF